MLWMAGARQERSTVSVGLARSLSLPAKAGVAEVVGYLHCTIIAVEQCQILHSYQELPKEEVRLWHQTVNKMSRKHFSTLYSTLYSTFKFKAKQKRVSQKTILTQGHLWHPSLPMADHTMA